jgi:TolB-like protein/DNA-binding winged helix-turn-helix (wHTH) protein/Flp pilus assembly protein TadD
MQQPSTTKFSFGPFVLDPLENVLLRAGHPVHLPPKAFETLLTLVKNKGHVVQKAELLNRVWPDTFVEEATLAQNIFVLRKALGNGGNGHEYIETVPKRGYRFVGPVQELPAPVLHESSVPATRRAARVPRIVAVACALAVLTVVGGWFAWKASHSTQPRPSPKTMLAVLPLVNLSGDPGQDYFCDGLTEQLLTDFGSLNPDRLGVIARTTIMQYKKTGNDVARIGNELKVDYVLEGSVAREKEQVRIDAQLIRVQDQTHVWAHMYERDHGGALALQNDVARAIANAVATVVAPSSQPPRTSYRTLNPMAYEAYLQGRYFWNKRSEQGHLKAIEYFNQALREDSGYAQAYSGLADAYALLGSNANHVMRRADAMEKARAAASQALAIDDTLAEAHTSLAFVYWHYDWNWPAAEKEFRRALQLNPSYPTAHHWYALYLLSQERTNEALQEIRAAQQLDPLSLIIGTDMAQVLLVAKQYNDAFEQLHKVLEMDPHFVLARVLLSWCLLELQQPSAALAQARKAFDDSRDVDAEMNFAVTCAAGGDKETARAILRQLEKYPTDPVSVGLAQAYAMLGQKDQAFAALEKAVQSRNGGLTLLKVVPFLDSLHGDPRFAELVRRIGLPS